MSRPRNTARKGGHQNANERKCIVTGELLPRDALIRFVVDPEGAVTPDLAEKLPGRGAWVRADKEKVAQAIARRCFNRAFSADVAAGDALAMAVEDGMRRRAIAALGLARRAGFAVAGFDQVAGELKAQKASLLISACDAAADGADKLARMARGTAVIRALTSAEISSALGRDGVRHAAIKKRAETASFKRDILRFKTYMHGQSTQEDDHKGGFKNASADN